MKKYLIPNLVFVLFIFSCSPGGTELPMARYSGEIQGNASLSQDVTLGFL